MTTVLEAPRTRPTSQRLLTEADLAALPEHLPSGPVNFELVHGELVAMSPTGVDHGHQLLVLGYRFMALELAGEGKSAGDTYIVLGRHPDHLRAPDLFFATPEQLPLRKSKEGYTETIPKVVVEIRSKNDSVREVTEKLGEYLAAGVVEAWLVDPFRQVVEIHTADGVRSFGVSDTVLSSVLPGFAAPVAELIAE